MEVEQINDYGLTRDDKPDNWAGWTLLGGGKSWDWGGYHSEIVEIQEWQHDLWGDVYLSGAFDGECIEDMSLSLDAIGQAYQRIEPLII